MPNPYDFLIHVSDYNKGAPDNLYLLCGDGNMEPMAPAINEAASAKALTPNAQPWKWIIEIFKNFILNIADSQDDWMFFVDTNPSFSIYTQMAIAAVERLLTPINADDSSKTAASAMIALLHGTNPPHPIYGSWTFAEVAKQERDTLLERVDRMEVLLKQVAKVLAYNTNYATMVTAPNYEKTVKFIQLSLVDEKTLLAVIVVEGNIIKNQMIHINVSLDNEDVLKFNILLNTFLQGASLEDINLEMIQAMKKQSGGYGEILDQIFQGIVEAIHEAQELEVYTSGATNILKYPELGDISKTSELLEKLEDKNEVSHLLEETTGKTNESGIQVYIGDETPSLKDCSLVTATYQMPEGAKGTIGILGPKRMDYKKVVSTLKNLTIELDEIFKKGEGVNENGQ